MRYVKYFLISIISVLVISISNTDNVYAEEKATTAITNEVYDKALNFAKAQSKVQNLIDSSKSALIIIMPLDDGHYLHCDIYVACYDGKAEFINGIDYIGYKVGNSNKGFKFTITDAKDNEGFYLNSSIRSFTNEPMTGIYNARGYLVKGSANIVGDGNSKLYDGKPKENISKFDWVGDGIRIETPQDKTSLITTKYKDTPGVFVNILLKTNERPPNKLFSDIEEDISKSLKYKWKKTGTEEVLESGKVKVTDIEVVNGFLERGETRYRIKGFIPIDTKGVYDLYVSSEFEVLNVNNPLSEKRVYYDDTNSSIQIRNEQYSGVIDDVIEGNTGGSSNSNGSVETGAPQKPNSANPVDWLIYIVDLLNYWISSVTDGFLTLISSLVNAFSEVSSELINAVEKFGQVFSMLPSPLPQLITLTITIACGTTIFKLVRG